MFTKTIVLGLALAATPTLQAQLHPLDLLFGDLPTGTIANDVHQSRDVVLADMDGDGDLDCLVANLDQDNTLYLNDGTGALNRAVSPPFTTDQGNARGLAVGDIDGDGDLDVFVANSAEQTNSLYINQGGNPPTFVEVLAGPVVTDMGNSRQAEFADLDGDGDLDLFVTNWNNQDNFLYINQGGAQAGVEGSFARQLTGDAVTDGGNSFGMALGDVDGDGDLDLHVSNHSGIVGGTGAANALYLNDGSGVMTRSLVGTQSLHIENSLACSFADVEGDGDLDLLVGNATGQTNRLFINNGSGVFNSQKNSDLTTDRGKTIGSVWRDFDMDGDIDAILANRSPNLTSELFVNIGNGNFRRQTFGPLAANTIDTYDVAAGDLDDDGFEDIVLANFASVNLEYRNIGPQWRDLGNALAGSMQAPFLIGDGNGLANTEMKLRATNVPDDAFCYLVVGAQEASDVFYGGVLVIDPLSIIRILALKNVGTGNFVDYIATVPAAGLPALTDIFFQAWIQDAGAPQGFSATNGLRVTTP